LRGPTDLSFTGALCEEIFLVLSAHRFIPSLMDRRLYRAIEQRSKKCQFIFVYILPMFDRTIAMVWGERIAQEGVAWGSSFSMRSHAWSTVSLYIRNATSSNEL